jgi:hypothetical protein
MSKVFKTYNLLSVAGTTGTGTALAYGGTDKSKVQVVLSVNTAATTVIIYGTVAATSTGTYGVINSTTSTGTANYFVDISSPYTYVKAVCSAVGSTGAAGTVDIITQGER